MQPLLVQRVRSAMERIQLRVGDALTQAVLEVMHGLAVGVLDFVASCLLGS